MNVFALFAAFFSIVAVLLYYALLAALDENKQLRYKCNGLWRANIATGTHLQAASEMWEYSRQVEVRNDYLEATQTQFKNTLAGTILTRPPRALAVVELSEELFIVREGNAP